jgi:hypothetical protein
MYIYKFEDKNYRSIDIEQNAVQSVSITNDA